jgi:hypothetical protein
LGKGCDLFWDRITQVCQVKMVKVSSISKPGKRFFVRFGYRGRHLPHPPTPGEHVLINGPSWDFFSQTHL